jgi:hypothetical protein
MLIEKQDLVVVSPFEHQDEHKLHQEGKMVDMVLHKEPSLAMETPTYKAVEHDQAPNLSCNIEVYQL